VNTFLLILTTLMLGIDDIKDHMDFYWLSFVPSQKNKEYQAWV
jgi:hypothetical protein